MSSSTSPSTPSPEQVTSLAAVGSLSAAGLGPPRRRCVRNPTTPSSDWSTPQSWGNKAGIEKPNIPAARTAGRFSSSPSSAGCSTPAAPVATAGMRSLARRLASGTPSDSDESFANPSPAAVPVQPEEEDSPVAKVDARRLGALLEVSRACGTGLKSALTKLDQERAAGRAALAAAREREDRLRLDLQRKDAVHVANDQQSAALRQALLLAQRKTAQLEQEPSVRLGGGRGRSNSRERLGGAWPNGRRGGRWGECAEELRRLARGHRREHHLPSGHPCSK